MPSVRGLQKDRPNGFSTLRLLVREAISKSRPCRRLYQRRIGIRNTSSFPGMFGR